MRTTRKKVAARSRGFHPVAPIYHAARKVVPTGTNFPPLLPETVPLAELRREPIRI